METGIIGQKSGKERQKATQFSSDRQPEKPGGRPKGSRDKISRDFLTDLLAIYAEHGRAALEHVAKNDQSTFFKALIQLQPKEVVVTTPEGEMTDEQLEALYAQMLAWMSKQASGQPEKELH